MAQTAMVTGASSGIGREFALLLARKSYDLILLARNREQLQAVAAACQRAGSGNTEIILEDLADPASPTRIQEALKDRTIDVLINNAGYGAQGRFHEIDAAVEISMVQVNVTSLVDLTRRLLPGMVQRRSGKILNVASTAAFQPGPLMAVYFATKSFVLSFSEAIAQELDSTGVTVTVLCPGPVATGFARRANMEDTPLFKSGLKRALPASEVAEQGYAAMMRGHVIKIPGLSNRLGAELVRFAPRSLVRKMVYKMQMT